MFEYGLFTLKIASRSGLLMHNANVVLASLDLALSAPAAAPHRAILYYTILY